MSVFHPLLSKHKNAVFIKEQAKQLTRVAYGLEQAKELEMKLNYELKENQTGNISFMELYEEYARNQKHEVRETTYERTFRTIGTYILPTFKDTKLKKMTLQSLQKTFRT